jgi:hypothetical protein
MNNILSGKKLLLNASWVPDTIIDSNLFHPAGKAKVRFPGLNAVIADPLFKDAVNGDYRLHPGSPAIGKGRPLEVNADPPNIGATTDLLVAENIDLSVD